MSDVERVNIREMAFEALLAESTTKTVIHGLLAALDQTERQRDELRAIRKRLDHTVKKLADGSGVDWADLVDEYGYLRDGDLL